MDRLQDACDLPDPLRMGCPRTALKPSPPRRPDLSGRRRRTSPDAGTVHSLLENKADVNAPQPDGMTALHWAALHDDLETVKLLLGRRRRREGNESLRRDPLGHRLHRWQRPDRRAAARFRGRSGRLASPAARRPDDRRAHRPARQPSKPSWPVGPTSTPGNRRARRR